MGREVACPDPIHFETSKFILGSFELDTVKTADRGCHRVFNRASVKKGKQKN